MDQRPPSVFAKGPAVRDLVMMVILLVWLMYALAAVFQLFKSGAQVLDSLPPFWFWGVPIGPYTMLYQPWVRPGGGAPPEPPAAPETPGAPA